MSSSGEQRYLNSLPRPPEIEPARRASSIAIPCPGIALPKQSNAISNGKIVDVAGFYAFASRMRVRISRTASESPVRTARAMMLWPMLNSVISGMAATSPMLR